MKPTIVKCRSLFNGNASVGSHIVEHCLAEKIPIKIQVGTKVMTVAGESEFKKFFTFGSGEGRRYPDQSGPGYYTLRYIKFEEDK
jgi:hypothetical protein